MRPVAMALVSALTVLSMASSSRAEVPGSPDILILGDSQLSFGAGAAFVDLIDRLAGDCGLAPGTTTGVIGVRSSTLMSWTGQSKSAKGAICDVDKKWKVNAGAYGTLSPGENPYVQIGKGDQFQFCLPERSPLEAVFFKGAYAPKLLIMFLMGNATERWAGSPQAAVQDARAFVADLPAGQRCIFMTSAPPYEEKSVRLRQRAQDNIERAFAGLGKRCGFVPGFTAATIAENMGNAANFRRKPSGKVKDPFHPTEAAARRFLALQRPALCAAIRAQLAP
ncbi:MAG: SGNH/GDSL hydrolase family protein [Rhodobacterales bacterium]|nr:SGNH/GDSL hydrolase family protein [Rhodobacterales bacterium]